MTRLPTHVVLMSAHGLDVSEDHPLALELASLRASVARYQHEAHTASVKLQRHSLEASEALERTHAVERENARLYEEIRTLRANPDLTPHPAALQVPELSLALRRLSDKLTYTEDLLLSRTNELAQTHNDLAKAQSDAAAAQEVAKQARAREEEGKARERDLERKARAVQEECRLADLALQEYADLVRNLEGRHSKGSVGSGQSSSDLNVTPLESLAEGKSGLQKLLNEFNSETERLSLEVNRLQAENELLKVKLDAERRIAETDRQRFSETTLELDRYKADDDTAAKMVSRYMKFSQSTTDSLQEAMESLRQRHTAAVATLELRLHNLHKSLHSERRQAEKLRHALDELSEDISREAFGRRREISLRLAFLTREEGLAESLRRWLRKSREAFDRSFSSEGADKDQSLREMYDRILREAEELLETLNGHSEDSSSGTVARFLLAQDSVSSLTRELQHETERRLEAERRLAHMELAAEALIDGAHQHDVLEPISPPPPPRTESVLKLNGTLKTENHNSLAKPVALADVPVLIQVEPEAVYERESREKDDDHVLKDMAPITRVEFPSVSEVEEKPSPPPKDTRVLEPLNSISMYPQDPPVTQYDVIHTAPSEQICTTEHQDAVYIPTVEERDEVPLQLAFPAAPTLPPKDIIYKPIPIIPAEQHASISTAVSGPSPSDDSATYILDSPPLRAASPTALLVTEDSNPGPIFSQDIEDIVTDVPARIEIETVKPPRQDPLVSTETKQPLLSELAGVKARYDELQKALRDCSLALKELRKDLLLLPPGPEAVVRTVVDRLSDYNEDARVELEIRVADEERISAGYRTLLTVPGAISDEVDESEMSLLPQAGRPTT
ncbi:hypothetical protein NM688_g9001 [Phlebia brevispora]|uniref:Uncharacterized protein n=1 Tax=Phlebia brevispora TaxID=194682 RepID=A0ACC1RKK9_9APHY|nr:hypothetical protein NM688_g9001 [Phlebia brevispora]